VKGKRHHVHLSADMTTAQKVGGRRGDAVILKIDAAAMHRDGLAFFISTNGVWLSDAVPAKYIEFPA
jgi:putative RNA 2'-phosphotransferase